MQKIISTGFEKDRIPWYGNKFLNGNGYFGVRGTMEEYTKENMPAINMAGIYDRVGNAWRESINAPNVLYTYIKADGCVYALPDSEPYEHTHTLDYHNGLQSRKTVWKTDKGLITVESERFADMERQHLIAMRYSVSADYDCDMEIVTGIDGDVWDINGPHFAKLDIKCENGVKTVIGTTVENSVKVTSTEYTRFDFDAEKRCEITDTAALGHISFRTDAGKKYTIEKVAEIYTSVDTLPRSGDITSITFDEARDESVKKWNEIQAVSEVTIDGDEKAQQAAEALNYALYHMNCIGPRNMKSMSIPARGLSGQVYKGAVFWDTEMFMVDYFAYTQPEVAKTLIRYRIDTIGGARQKAKEYGLNGAYYAWESQEGGYEACSDYNVTDVFTKRPMRTYFRDKQYHVSAAVVYAIMKYIDATGDTSILAEGAAEVAVECARMYRCLLLKYADKDKYEIHDVVGPDEYHERVNNNAYTNRMAKFVFEKTVEFISEIKNEYKDCYDELDKKYDLKSLESIFDDSAKNLYIPQPDSKSGVIEQFDGYFSLEDTSVDEVRSRLLDPTEYWGGAYGVATDTQVLKQADVVAMLSMFKDDYSEDIMKANWSYYEPRTEHGSSLSACMYSLLSCYIENPDAAYPLFIKSASADLVPGSKEWIGPQYIGGTHPASEGGAWIVAIKGFAGMTVKDGKPSFKPALPTGWTGMHFKVLVCGKLYDVKISGKNAEVNEINQ